MLSNLRRRQATPTLSNEKLRINPITVSITPLHQYRDIGSSKNLVGGRRSGGTTFDRTCFASKSAQICPLESAGPAPYPILTLVNRYLPISDIQTCQN